MKKLILMLLLVVGGVNVASADNYVKGSWDWDNPTIFTFTDGFGTATVTLEANTTYAFGIMDGSTFFKNEGTMTESNCKNWGFRTDSNNAQITTTTAGAYTFKIHWVGSTPYVSVFYPAQPKEFIVHFKNTANWSKVYAYRFLAGTESHEANFPGKEISENPNNPGYYDVTFSDTYNRIVFSAGDNNDSNKSGDVVINFERETWVEDNATTTTTAPNNWVGYTRNVTSGNFGTICLPYAATVTGATVFEITSKVMDGSVLKGLNLSSVSSLVAGKAYIFKATESTLTATYTGSYADATEANGMMGNLSASKINVPEGNYVVGNDNLVHKVVAGGDGVTIGQYRAYITLNGINEVPPSSARGTNFIEFEENTTTGIKAIDTETEKDVMFNLQGQRVVNTQKGLYIVNGKKVIKK